MPAVVISPFANERVRQWPARNYRELIEIIGREHGFPVMVVGTREQRAAANDLVRGLSSEQVSNACGKLRWAELVEAIDEAPYVVANNSGVAHLAAGRGRWTLCIFSASHAVEEWMPRGPLAVTVFKTPALCALRARRRTMPKRRRLHDGTAAGRRLPPIRIGANGGYKRSKML